VVALDAHRGFRRNLGTGKSLSFVSHHEGSALSFLTPTHKLYRVHAATSTEGAATALSKLLKEITGYSADDYIPPVSEGSGELVTLISDESLYKDHICVSLVVLPFLSAERFEHYERELKELVERCGMSHIRFSDIFGRKRLAGDHRDRFLVEYAKIVATLPMSCLSLSRPRETLVRSFPKNSYTNEELFHSLFWNNVARVVPALRPFSVVHILKEVENNFTEALCVREFDKLMRGVTQLEELSQRRISVCRHPTFFTKQALLYSSLADLVAYATNVVQQKLDAGLSSKKVAKRHNDILTLIRRAFLNYSGVACRDLIAEYTNDG
jgi:hypothetical protein